VQWGGRGGFVWVLEVPHGGIPWSRWLRGAVQQGGRGGLAWVWWLCSSAVRGAAVVGPSARSRAGAVGKACPLRVSSVKQNTTCRSDDTSVV
jgi:hypothetical protein